MLRFVHHNFLSAQLKTAITIAQAIAREKRNREFTPAHLLKGFLHKDVGLVPMLVRLQKDVIYLQAWADANIESCAKASSLPAITGDKCITDIMYEANRIRLLQLKDTIHPVYALSALITPGVCFNCEQLKTFPLRHDELMVPDAEIFTIEIGLHIGTDAV